jgi:FAD/FMN-containing dehydrogenase
MTYLPNEAINSFRESFQGPIITPTNDEYDEARKVWNGIFDKHPVLITRCLSTSDVINAVSFARNNTLLTAVRGAGHNSAGNATCDGGIIIDLSLMRRVNVAPAGRPITDCRYPRPKRGP